MSSPSALQSSFRSFLALSRMEWQIGGRTPAFRILLICALLLGFVVGGALGRGCALSAYGVAETAWKILGLTAIVWVSIAAVRESMLRTDRIVFSKPQPADRLALAKFAGVFFQILILLASMFVGGFIAHLVSGAGLLGVQAYFIQYFRVAAILFLASTASFCLALLFDSAIAGALIGLYWALTLTGKGFLSKIFFPAYTQNQPAYIALGLALLLVTCLLYQRSRRGISKPPLWIQWGGPVCFLVAIFLFYGAIRNGHDRDSFVNPALELMGQQDTWIGSEAPGMTLPDQNHKLIGLSDFPGKIMVIALWSPEDSDSAELLAHLQSVQEKYGASGVQAFAIGISPDTGAAYTFAHGANLSYPVVMDWGTYNSPKGADLSPIAAAYQANSLPKICITNRRRQVITSVSSLQSIDDGYLEKYIETALKAEPK